MNETENGQIVSDPHTGNDHSNSHGHDVIPAPTKVPQWILDYIEPVFKVQKRKSTVEVI